MVLLVGVSVLPSAAGLFALSTPAAERGWQRNQLAQRRADIRSALEVLRLHLGRQRETVCGRRVPGVGVVMDSSGDRTRCVDLASGGRGSFRTNLASSSRIGTVGPSVTPKEWWGRVDELAPFSAALTKARQATSVRSLLQTEMSLEEFTQIEPLLTVHAEAPELQMDGRQRLPLGGDWNSEIAARVAERFGQVASDVLSDLSAKGQMPQDVGDSGSCVALLMSQCRTGLKSWMHFRSGLRWLEVGLI